MLMQHNIGTTTCAVQQINKCKDIKVSDHTVIVNQLSLA